MICTHSWTDSLHKICFYHQGIFYYIGPHPIEDLDLVEYDHKNIQQNIAHLKKDSGFICP